MKIEFSVSLHVKEKPSVHHSVSFSKTFSLEACPRIGEYIEFPGMYDDEEGFFFLLKVEHVAHHIEESIIRIYLQDEDPPLLYQETELDEAIKYMQAMGWATDGIKTCDFRTDK